MKLRSCLLVLAACVLPACATTTGEAPVGPAPSPVIIVVTATPTPTPEVLTHTVARGDTLGRIARTYGVSVQALVELNNIADPDRISVGQVLVLPQAVAAPATAAPQSPAVTPTSTVEATATSLPTTTMPPTATPEATATATLALTATDTPAPTLAPTATPTATAVVATTATATRVPTEAPEPTVAATSTAAPTFAPTATFLPTATRTPRPTATPRPTPSPTATSMPSSEVGGVNLTPEDEALAAAMQAAMAQYGVQRVVIADAREQGGARVAIGTLILTKEQESGGKELSLPMGAMFAAAYRVAALAGEKADLDSIAVVVASSEGNATALVGTRIGDVKAFVEGTLSEADFVRLWVVRDF